MHAVIYAIFIPRVILCNFFHIFAHYYGGLGFWGFVPLMGLFGLGFSILQLMGFGSCGVGPSGFLRLGLSI